MSKNNTWQGYLRQDGRKGIRNNIIVAYMVECAHHVATQIALPYASKGAEVIGFSGCYPNSHADKVMRRLVTHPNVGAVLLVSLGCESFDRHGLRKVIQESGRPTETVVIQEVGGTKAGIEKGQAFIESAIKDLENTPRVEMSLADLTIGAICGGSDATSGISGNPAVGLAFDELINEGGRAIFEETGEMIGLDDHILPRAKTPGVAESIKKSLEKAYFYYDYMGHGSFAPGNADGGLSTIEEKSLGAYSKSGSQPISGLIKPGDVPEKSGLYLLDVVPDGTPKFGFPNINDNAEISELIACGSHLIYFITGRGSVVGSPISPVIKVAANPETYKRMSGDMDINAGKVVDGEATLSEVGKEIVEYTKSIAAGQESKSEGLGHREFVLQYKSFEPIGPSCLA